MEDGGIGGCALFLLTFFTSLLEEGVGGGYGRDVGRDGSDALAGINQCCLDVTPTSHWCRQWLMIESVTKLLSSNLESINRRWQSVLMVEREGGGHTVHSIHIEIQYV